MNGRGLVPFAHAVTPAVRKPNVENSVWCPRIPDSSAARKCQEIFTVAVLTSHAGKPVVQIAAIEPAIDHLLDMGPPESLLPGEMLIINPDKGFMFLFRNAPPDLKRRNEDRLFALNISGAGFLR